MVLSLACGGPEAPPAPTMHSSLQAYAQAKSVHLMGTVTYGADAYDLDLSVDGGKRAAGTVTHAGDVVRVLDDGAQVYMQGKDYFGKRLKFPVFDRSVVFPADPVAGLVVALADRPALAAALEKAAGGSVSRKSGSASGARTTALSSAQVTVQVPAGSSKPPVQIDTSPATNLGGSITQLHLKLSDYGVPFTVTTPEVYVNSADPTTWPPYFVYAENTFAFQNCDNNGCTLAAAFTNNGGKGPGSPSVHFLVKSDTGAEVAGCDVPLPPTASGDTASVSCRVAYDRSQGGHFTGTEVLHNPTS